MFRGSAGVWNADAADWIKRVEANSGSVSTATANAVTTFCNAIDAAGIRDRFYRLNMFCGTGLNACLVPLYRGPSLSGTQYGNATDTNNGPFVSGDYVETGASGGLLGNGSSKYLNTGLAPDALPQFATGHLSFWTRGGSVSGVRRPIGTDGSALETRFFLDRRPVASGGDLCHWGSLGVGNTTDDDAAGLFSGSRISATDLRFFKNGSQAGATQSASVTTAANAYPWLVFAGNVSGSPTAYYDLRMTAYSIGNAMTTSQMTTYYIALNTFMVALSRT
jgi:hypothetical protein